MNLPNKITMLRVLLIPIFVVFMLVPSIPYHAFIATGIFVIASLTDTLDGYLARKYNLVSNFGKFMDPLADKLLVSAALIGFVELSRVPAWIVILIISREFIISGFRLVASDAGVVIAASWWGKSKTIVQMIMIIFMLPDFAKVFAGFKTPIFWIEQVLIYVALLLTIISLCDYLVKNWKVMNDGNM